MRDKKKADIDEEAACPSFGSSINFLVAPRATVVELISVLVLTPVYTMLMTAFIHPAFLTQIGSPSESIKLAQILTLVTILLSSYCLISQPFKETTTY